MKEEKGRWPVMATEQSGLSVTAFSSRDARYSPEIRYCLVFGRYFKRDESTNHKSHPHHPQKGVNILVLSSSINFQIRLELKIGYCPDARVLKCRIRIVFKRQTIQLDFEQSDWPLRRPSFSQYFQLDFKSVNFVWPSSISFLIRRAFYLCGYRSTSDSSCSRCWICKELN
nr:hypothetical protein CFP56_22096 [Quercus suber]